MKLSSGDLEARKSILTMDREKKKPEDRPVDYMQNPLLEEVLHGAMGSVSSQRPLHPHTVHARQGPRGGGICNSDMGAATGRAVCGSYL